MVKMDLSKRVSDLIHDSDANVEAFISYVADFLSEKSLENVLKTIVTDFKRFVWGIDCSIYLLPEFLGDKFNGRLLNSDFKEFDSEYIETDFIVLATTSQRNQKKNYLGKKYYEKGEGLTGWIFQNGKPIELADMQNEAELAKFDPPIKWTDKYGSSEIQFKNQDQPKPFLGMPLKGVDEEVFGVIKIPESQHGSTIPKHSVNFLMSFATVLSNIIQRTKLIKDKETQVEDLLKIGIISNEKDLYQTIAKTAMRLVECKYCSLFLLDEDIKNEERYYLRASEGQPNYLKDRVNTDYYNKGEGLTGWIAKHGKTLNIKDITNGEELKHIAPDLKWKDKEGEWELDPSRPKAYLGVPLYSEHDNKVIGIIRIPVHKLKSTFSKADEIRLETFAKYVVLVLEKAKRLEEKEREHINKLIEIGRTLDLQNLLRLVVNEANSIIEGNGCSIFLKDVKTEKFILKAISDASHSKFKEQLGDLFYYSGEGKTGYVIKTGRPLLLNNNKYKPKILSLHKSKHHELCETGSQDARKFLAVPIKDQKNEVIGVIRIPRTEAAVDFTESDQQKLESMANQVALVIRNSELFKEREHRLQALETITKLNEQLQKIDPEIPIHKIKERINYLALTCLTIADGLGFNRAIMFKYDQNVDRVTGAFGVGTLTSEEADKVWNELDEKEYNFEHAVLAFDNNTICDSNFCKKVKELTYENASIIQKIPILPITTKNSWVIKININLKTGESVEIDEEFVSLINTKTFALVPLIGRRSMVLGAIYFDNKHNAQPITEEDVHLVEIIANQVAIAIENAQLISELKKRTEMERKQLDEMAHALKTPNQPLILAIDKLRKNKFKNFHEQKEYINILTRNIYNARLLSKNILYTSQISMGTFKVNEKLIDIRTLVRAVFDLFQLHAKQKHIKMIDPHFDLKHYNILMDETMLEIALHNLVSNAINYSTNGSEVKIKIIEQAKNMSFIITNQGEIIDKENQEKIFHLYEKGSNSSGAGLGLYITKKIAEFFNGAVKVDSSNNLTTFTLNFPVKY